MQAVVRPVLGVATVIASALAGLVLDAGHVLTCAVSSIALPTLACANQCNTRFIWAVPRPAAHCLVVHTALYHLVQFRQILREDVTLLDQPLVLDLVLESPVPLVVQRRRRRAELCGSRPCI